MLSTARYTEDPPSRASQSGSGCGRVASARRRDDIEKAMDESLLEVIPRIEKRTHYLSSLANVGLLIGLLGTITGLAQVFAAQVVEKGQTLPNKEAVVQGISLALTTTMIGLCIAIPALVGNSFLHRRVELLATKLEMGVERLIALTKRS